jgi:hypothetical protein
LLSRASKVQSITACQNRVAPNNLYCRCGL